MTKKSLCVVTARAPNTAFFGLCCKSCCKATSSSRALW